MSSLITPQRSVLLIIDEQEKLLPAVHNPEKVIKNTALAIKCANELGITLLATTQYKKGIGNTVPEIMELLGDAETVDKVEFNAAANPDFQDTISSLPLAIDTVLIAGVEAHICVFQTAVGLRDLGYRPYVLADAVSSREKKNAKWALKRLMQMGITVGTTEMAIYELLGKAGTSEFKNVLKHVK